MSKVPRIDPSIFSHAAVPQADPVEAVASFRAEGTASEQRPEALPAPAVAPPRAAKSKARHQKPSREGRVQIMGWFPTATRLALKRHALETNKTLEQVMGEAFDLYLARHRGRQVST